MESMVKEKRAIHVSGIEDRVFYCTKLSAFDMIIVVCVNNRFFFREG